MKSIASQSNVGFGALKAAGGRAVRPAPSRTGTTVLWLSVVAVLPLSRCCRCRCRRDGAVAVGDGGAAGVGAVAIGAAAVGAAGAVPLSVLSLSVLSLPPPRPAPVRQRRQVTGPG